MTRLALLPLLFLTACASVTLPDGSKVETRGSASATVMVDGSTGDVAVELETTGANLLYAFEAAVEAARAVFGRSGDAEVNVIIDGKETTE